MKRGIAITVLISLAVLGCGQQQRRLKVTYLSDPPGGALYRQNGERWGTCPKTLWYDLDEETLAAGQLKAKGLIVRWPSGPEKRSDDLITFPIDGSDRQFTFTQSGAVPSTPIKETVDASADPNDKTARQVEIEKTDPGQDPGLREEPNEEKVQTADASGAANVGNGVIESEIGARSLRDPVRGPGEGQAAKPPEDPIEKVIPSEVEPVSVDIGDDILIEFVKIESGTFAMGTDEDGGDANSPTREVRISKPFYMGKFEVTQEQYEKITGRNPSRFSDLQRPVEGVSWKDAKAFCAALSSKLPGQFRLPTEAEWEYACRARSKTAYYWGDDFDGRYARTIVDRKTGTHDVGTLKPNDWGLYDMSGNVWEWCHDWHKEYDSRLTQVTDPQGPATGEFRVLRGGSWGHTARNCRSGHRNWHTPNHRYDDCGFRIVMEIE